MPRKSVKLLSNAMALLADIVEIARCEDAVLEVSFDKLDDEDVAYLEKTARDLMDPNKSVSMDTMENCFGLSDCGLPTSVKDERLRAIIDKVDSR